MLKKISVLICVIIFFYSPFSGLQVSANCQMKIGVATVDITPKESIMLVGYASRKEPSKGVIHPIYAKAIAFEDPTGKRAVLVTTDLIGFVRYLSDEIANRVETELDLPRECLMLTSSHTHTAPLLHKSKLNMLLL